MPAHLRTLGAIDLRAPDGGELRSILVQPKRVALLSYLVVATPHGFHRRDSLLALLWPDQDTAHARASLRQALHAVGRSLGKGVLLRRGDEVGLEPGGVECDVLLFQRAIAAGSWAEAVSRYGGSFLPGFFVSGAPDFEHWAETQRSELARAYGTALERLAEQTVVADPASAIGWWRKLAEHDPYSPRIALRLMQALEAAGDAPAAIRHADRYAILMREELDAAPDPQVSALADRFRKSPQPAALSEPPLPAAGKPAPPDAGPITAAAVGRRLDGGRLRRLARHWTLVPGFGLLLLVGWWATAGRVEALPGALGVLPFGTTSQDPRQVLLARALTEALLTNLGIISTLDVTRSPAGTPAGDGRSPRAIAEDLGVSHLLAGSVSASGERIRVNVRLVDAYSGESLLARDYGGSPADLFSIDDEVTRDVAQALGVSLPPQVRARLALLPANANAFEHYVRGLVAFNDWNTTALDTAIAALENAVAADSGSAAARAMLANAYLEKVDIVDPRSEYLARARVLTETALHLDPDLAEAHVAMGNLLWTAANGFRHDEAVREFKRAVVLQPNLATAHDRLALIYVHVGLLDLAMREAQLAVARDPLHYWARFRIGHVLATQQRYREAADSLSKVPRQVIPNLRWALLGEALLYLGKPQDARKLLDGAIDSLPRDPWIRGTRALVRAALGDGGGAEADMARAGALAEGMAHGHHAEFMIGLAYAVLGRDEESIEWLRRAARNGWPCYPRYANDPLLRRLRGNPGFEELLRDLRTQWTARAHRFREPSADPAGATG